MRGLVTSNSSVYDSDPEDDEYKYTEQANMPGTKFDNKKRQTVRNLRIREDTAKVYFNSITFPIQYSLKTTFYRRGSLHFFKLRVDL